MQECVDCGERKPIEAFSRGGNTKTGYQRRCKACQSVYYAEWRRAKLALNPHFEMDRKVRWLGEDGYRRYMREYMREYQRQKRVLS